MLLKWCEWFAFLGDVEITNLSSHQRSIWCSHKSTIVCSLSFSVLVGSQNIGFKTLSVTQEIGHFSISWCSQCNNWQRHIKKTPQFYLATLSCLHWSKKNTDWNSNEIYPLVVIPLHDQIVQLTKINISHRPFPWTKPYLRTDWTETDLQGHVPCDFNIN